MESFTAETLYEKINGRAEQYTAYDVVGMDFIALASEEGQFIDVFVYDMGGVANAFGIYAIERPENAEMQSLGDQGYRAESSFFFGRDLITHRLLLQTWAKRSARPVRPWRARWQSGWRTEAVRSGDWKSCHGKIECPCSILSEMR